MVSLLAQPGDVVMSRSTSSLGRIRTTLICSGMLLMNRPAVV